MRISRLTNLTLGVGDLDKAMKFYEAVFDTPPNTSTEGIVFIELPGAWVSLYPLKELAEDISPTVPVNRDGFSGITLSHNVGSKEEVIAVIECARSAGANVIKEPQDTFWGGFGGYFADLDGYYWEVVWGPMFGFSENGELRLKDSV